MSRIQNLLATGLVFTLSLGTSLAAQAKDNFEQVFRDHGSSYILVFAFPSAAYLDWSSPSNLARTSLNSTLAKRTFSLPTTIGHAQIAWSCRQPDGTLLSSGASGQSGEDNGQSLKALLAGWGMSILELVYTDGHLERAPEVAARIEKGAATNQFAWAGFKVSTDQCMNLAQYVQDYTNSGKYINYGFPVDPLKYQGAGCTSYANAALQMSGAPIPIRDYWVRDYFIPEDQMGRREELPPVSTIVPAAQIPQRQHQVSLGDFIFGDKQWAKTDQNATHFRYYDPELFYESFLHLENSYRLSHNMSLKAPIRTAQYDPFQQRLKVASENWMKQLETRKSDMILDNIAGKSGLILDLRD